MQGWSNKRTEKSVAKWLKQDPEELVWVYKSIPEAYLDEYRLWRLIPKNNMGNARKGGWLIYKKLDNDQQEQV